MQVTETARDGLKRTLKVVVDKAELDKRFSVRLDEMKGRVQIKGFRKGKVPAPHLKKVYGKALMAEVLEEAVKETSAKAMAERNERPALQPKIDIFDAESGNVERIISGDADLAYSMSFEVLPPVPVADLATLEVEKLVADVDEGAVDNAVEQLVERSIRHEPEDGRKAQTGDRVKIDFVGKIDGETFDGGKGEGLHLVLGKGGFIPGFEDGLIGAAAGDDRVVTGTFPAEYPVKELAGKDAIFDVKVHEVAKPVRPDVDDEFAKGLGAETVANLRDLVKEQLEREFAQASRVKLKRQLLDQLDKAHDFDLPPSLVDYEFNNIWAEVERNLKASGKSFEDEGKTEESARAEYKKIAERRVRLGLVVGDIGDKNQIKVSQDELRRALIDQARRYPGQEKMVYDYYEKTPGALAELRAPIFEDKVIDLILDKAKAVEKKVSRDELFSGDGDDETA